ncbi:MAG: sugar phosphate isomerase/epimerase family protein [Puniceicoccaceae bacterium]
MQENRITVFTKPWQELSLEELADKIQALGFDGIELPVRPGFQVEPESVHEQLPVAVKVFADRGLRIESVASQATPEVIEACHRAGVPMVRVMLPINPEAGYRESVKAFQTNCLALEPLLKDGPVTVGVQNHCGNFVGTAVGLMEALAPLPESFVAVLDFAHTSLAGEPEPYAMELALPRLGLVNLKNARPVVRTVDEQGEAKWDRQWVGAKEGLTSWSTVVDLLRRHNYQGSICLTCEYRAEDLSGLKGDAVLPLISEDLQYLKALLKR